jgi:hypothetical protein
MQLVQCNVNGVLVVMLFVIKNSCKDQSQIATFLLVISSNFKLHKLLNDWWLTFKLEGINNYDTPIDGTTYDVDENQINPNFLSRN